MWSFYLFITISGVHFIHTLIKINTKIHFASPVCVCVCPLTHTDIWVCILMVAESQRCISLEHLQHPHFIILSSRFSCLYQVNVWVFPRWRKRNKFRNKLLRPSPIKLINVKRKENYNPSLIIQRNNKTHFRPNHWAGLFWMSIILKLDIKRYDF